ncbi:MAG: hypothetical protein DWP98_11600 [Bacteroidetes bacterium]|nr:MAG: hypothetical protein DWP98_11600 [Bacteroidota bacterium]MBL1144021.1 hypothetical protein [Bacteroidota bacterium]NOG56821.1 sulfotransferase family 2 domain-containing protein [Bacteroidota bacterium]
MKFVSNTSLLIIAGVHKAGTTSLFKYLSSHSRINPSTVKETHFFTPIRFGNTPDKIENYWKQFSPSNTHLWNLEASPSYFYGGEKLAHTLKHELNADIKTIIILRDPSKRFISFFNHGKYILEIDPATTLNQHIIDSKNACYTKLEDTRVSRGIREGFYIDYIKAWTNTFQNNNKIIFFEDLVSNPQAIVDDIFDWLGLETEIIKGLNEVENKTARYKNKFIHSISIKINATLSSFFIKQPTIKKQLRRVYRLINNKEGESQDYSSEKQLLDSIYKEKNQELKEYLIKNNLCKKLPDWLL